MMRDLIIGGCAGYTYDKVKGWINSINQSGFDGDKVLIVFSSGDDSADTEFMRQVSEQGFDVYNTALNSGVNSSSIHVQRFLAISEYIRNNPARYVITTDVRDVVFQYNPINWLTSNLGDKKLVVASECLRYQDEGWGNNNLLETYGPYVHNILKTNTIYNVGILAGESEYIRDLCLNIALHSSGKPIKICDQAVFNQLIDNKIYKDATFFSQMKDGWAANLGTVADERKMHMFRPNLLEGEPRFDGNYVYNEFETKMCIVHQYIRTVNLGNGNIEDYGQWKEDIERMYGVI
jgi:hypothetical protein